MTNLDDLYCKTTVVILKITSHNFSTLTKWSCIAINLNSNLTKIINYRIIIKILGFQLEVIISGNGKCGDRD